MAYYFIAQMVVETPMYLRSAKPFYSDAEREEIVLTIATDPEAGDLTPGTGGYRKLRFARPGMGKRGGARVIYLYGGEDFPIFLITVYAKSEKGNLSKAEQNALAKMAKSFFADYRGTR
jgi:hypothetical protein